MVFLKLWGIQSFYHYKKNKTALKKVTCMINIIITLN